MARHQLTFVNRYRGLRTERQAADRRDRHVGICLIGLALAYSLFEIGAAIDNYATERAAIQTQAAEQATAGKDKAYKMLADCLNGRAIRVTNTNAAIFCDSASYQGGL